MIRIKERRISVRIDASVPMRYKEWRGNTPLDRGTLTKNLSEGGVKFRTERFIPLSCHLIVELNLPEVAKPIITISKIAWIKKLPAGDGYEVGSQFLQIGIEDRSIVRDFIEKQPTFHHPF